MIWKKLLYQVLKKPVELKTRKLIRNIWNRTSKIMMAAVNLRQGMDAKYDYQHKHEINTIIAETHNIIGELTQLGNALELKRKATDLKEAEKRSRQGRCEHCG